MTVLPALVVPALRDQLGAVKVLHEADLASGFGQVYLPTAIARKYPHAPSEWVWQYVFPSVKRSVDPRSKLERRHHLNENAVSRAVTEAVRGAGITKLASAHTLRHSFATHLIGERARHSDGSGAFGPRERGDDDDLHACTQQGRARGDQPTGQDGKSVRDCNPQRAPVP